MRWTFDEGMARPIWQRIGVAALAVLLGCLLTFLVQPWYSIPPLAPFYGVVAVAVWYGGLLGGVVSTVLSLIAYGLIGIPWSGSWSLTEAELPRVLSFLAFALLMVILGSSREHVAAELRASERRLRTMFETANEGIWLVDRGGQTQYANSRLADMLGMSLETLATANAFSFVFPEDVPLAQRIFATVLNGSAQEFDFRLRRLDGEEKRVLIGASPVRDDAGRIVGILGFLSDVTARRAAEAALSRANERFALAADAVHAMIFEWDIATGTFERSPGVYPITGYRPGDATNRRDWWLARIHPEDRDAYASAPVPQDAAGDRYEREYRIRHRDGRWITVWEQGGVVRDDQGAVTRIIGSVTDISGRSAAERALRLLEEFGRVLASSIDYEETLQRVARLSVPTLADWCFVDLLAANGAVRQVAVACRDDAPPHLASTAAPSSSDRSIPMLVQQVLDSGEAALVEIVPEGDSADGAPFRGLAALEPISLICAPLQVGGEIHGTVTLLTTGESGRVLNQDDLSLVEQLGRRAAVAIQNARLYREAQLAEDRYRGLFEGTKDAMLVVDAEGICLDANPALVEMVGRPREALVGHPAAQFVTDGPWDGASWERLRREGQWQGDFELRRDDGTLFAIESWFTLVTLPVGAAYAGVLRDVSERRRFERMQEEFLSSLAHDLKNPLTALRGQTQLMLRRLRRGEHPEPDRLQSGLEGIDSAAIRMTKLLDELSDVTRLRAGQAVELDRIETDLVDLARRITEEFQRTTEKHTLVVETDLASLPGEWDGPRLERVLGNLLGNAIKYSPRGGSILVRVARDDTGGGDALLSVQDHGVGIPAADRTRIFERYQRAGNVDHFAGSGIGLAGARRIVELHGGTISVESREGAGSLFVVRLPLTRGSP